ncbi:MAG: hypothetical protein U1E65_24700 [Myxococcota bacterium]
MRDSTKTISDKVLKDLTRRAQRLASTVEWATRGSANSVLRREGSRFGEVLEEWIDDIKALADSEDETAGDRLESFLKRLKLAEAKVTSWNLPEPPALELRAPAKRKKRKAAAA